jgi:hypothetical protein
VFGRSMKEGRQATSTTTKKKAFQAVKKVEMDF